VPERLKPNWITVLTLVQCGQETVTMILLLLTTHLDQ
jgi:hypothetical protein